MKRKIPPLIDKALTEKGYYNTNREDKIKSGKHCIEKLKQLRETHGKYFCYTSDKRCDLD